jgi:PAS domain S-box-containing protein
MSGNGKGLEGLTPSSVSDSRKIKEQTTELESLYRSMVELSPDGILTVDTRGRIKSCNTAITKMLGYPRDYLVGGHFAKLGALRLKDVPRYLKLFRDILGGKVGETIEVALYRQDRTLVFVDVRVNLLKIGNKTVIQASMRDITERKQAEQELQKKNEQLDAQNEELQATEEELRATNEELQAANEELRETQEQLVRSEKLAAIGQLASGVGHELRNPLGAIKNAVFFIRRKVAKTDLPAKEPKVMEFLDIVDGEVDAANKVITDLLDFSRVVKPTVSPASVASIIEDALGYAPMPKNIELVRDIDKELPMVMVDAGQIRQVLVNIILNAQQAMADGGKLNIRARSKSGFVEVGFGDTGCGIPGEIRKKIFDPLFTTKAKGIGLGLAVCKNILERHGGDIQVESEEGKGTTFTVCLPAK